MVAVRHPHQACGCACAEVAMCEQQPDRKNQQRRQARANGSPLERAGSRLYAIRLLGNRPTHPKDRHIRTFRQVDDHRLARALGKEVVLQLLSKLRDLNTNDRVAARIVTGGPSKYFDADPFLGQRKSWVCHALVAKIIEELAKARRTTECLAGLDPVEQSPA